jgi:hypothetical protein
MSHPHLLLVEGDDDAHAIRNLLYEHGISARFLDRVDRGDDLAIKQVEGVDDVPAAVRNELKVGPDLSALGVVADADQSPKGRWEAVWRAFHAYDEVGAVPALPREGWTGSVPTYEHEMVPVGTWIIPDNHSEGAIEEFAMDLVPEDDDLWDYSEEVIAGLPERRFDARDEGKAHIHTWLAWQETPREPIGRAITQDVLDPESVLALRFEDWVRRLFPTLETRA